MYFFVSSKAGLHAWHYIFQSCQKSQEFTRLNTCKILNSDNVIRQQDFLSVISFKPLVWVWAQKNQPVYIFWWCLHTFFAFCSFSFSSCIFFAPCQQTPLPRKLLPKIITCWPHDGTDPMDCSGFYLPSPDCPSLPWVIIFITSSEKPSKEGRMERSATSSHNTNT